MQIFVSKIKNIDSLLTFDSSAVCAGIPMDTYSLSATTTTTTVLWPFVQDYPRELIPEETFTHSHLL